MNHLEDFTQWMIEPDAYTAELEAIETIEHDLQEEQQA
jgi:hypothetical protein